jgi:CHAT domain-containing protein/Tfp pilus assembly protein PilF
MLLPGAGVLLASSELDEARALHREGRLREALEAYAVAVAVISETDLSDIAAARNNACVIRIGFAEYEQALAECSEAVRLRRELDDQRRLARALNNLGIIQQNLGDFDAATMAFGEALQINRSLDEFESQVINLSNLGTLEAIEGRYAEALEHHNRAAAVATLHASSDWSPGRLRIALINQGVVFEKVGAYRDALEHMQQARAIDSEQDPREAAQLLINLGVVYRNLGDPITAIDFFSQARSVYENLEDRTGITQAEINLAHAYHLNLDRPSDAETAYRLAHQHATEIGDRPLEIETTLYLGQFLTAGGRLSEAETIFEHSLELSEESGSSEGRWSALAGLGDIASSEGDLHLALDRYQTAVDDIDQIRADLSDSDLRTDYFRDKRPVFAKAIQVLSDLALESPDAAFDQRAFELVQRAKVRSLLDALGQGTTRLQPLSALEVASGLGPAALLEYFVTERKLLAWAVDSDGARLFDLGPPEEALSLVESIYRDLSSNREPSHQSLVELSKRLLPKEAPYLWNAPLLYVATDAELGRFPFDLLPIPGSSDRTLIEAVSLSYLPSASALAMQTASIPHSDLEVAGFANPGLELDSDGPGSFRDRLVRQFQLKPLPGSESELESLDRWLPQPQSLLRGPAATEQAFRMAFSQSPRVVHVATHSIIDDRYGLGTAIVLSPDDRDDGLLFPHELAKLDGTVGLSVLAACRTAVDHDRSVDTLDTLTGALLAGGSSAVLATLWDVGDEVTAVFMDQFYYRLGRGASASEALRGTKLALMADPRWDASPIWSAYVVIGDFQGGTVRAGRSVGCRLLLAGLALGVLIVVLTAHRRRRRYRY